MMRDAGMQTETWQDGHFSLAASWLTRVQRSKATGFMARRPSPQIIPSRGQSIAAVRALCYKRSTASLVQRGKGPRAGVGETVSAGVLRNSMSVMLIYPVEVIREWQLRH